jgi:formate dehydrogenase alpha subunit
MVNLTIDDKNVTVAEGTTILDAAATVGIKIPTLCWLQKVSPTGACRVCAVEIEGVERTMTACNTPVKDGIKVTTQSDRITTIRRKVMELMLVNHPLDCPICDAAGECDLQDACYGLDVTRQEYAALLERRPIRYDWPLIESDPNRCILCEKCVKVDHEVVGCDAIAVVNKGEATIIDTVDGKPLNCEFCGNCVAVCPTGTLISKPFKFRGRPWSFKVTNSVCAFCGNGCQIEYHSRNGRVERVTSDDSTFNNGNLCINGRFGYAYLNAPERLTLPLVKDSQGVQVKTDWNQAMAVAVQKLQEIIKQSGPNAVAGIGSPRLTNEENYLFQKLMRTAVGTASIDSEARLGFAGAQAVLLAKLGLSGASATLDKIDNAEAVLVFGCDLNAEATGAEYRVIKAATKNDATLVLANLRDVKLKKFANCHLKYTPGNELALINGLNKAILDAGLEDQVFIAAHVQNLNELRESLASQSLADIAAAAGVTEADLKEAAALIAGKKSVAILFGADLIRSVDAAAAVAAIADLALLTGCLGKEAGGLFPVDAKNNTQGMLDMGISPAHLPGYQPAPSTGRDLWQIIDAIEAGEVKALYLLGSDLASFPDSTRIMKAIAKLELLLVQDIFAGEAARLAHVVFPAAAGAEKSGSFTSTDSRIQCLSKAVDAPGEAREDWDILSELYNRLTFTTQPCNPELLLKEIRSVTTLYGTSCTVAGGRCTGTREQSFTVKGGFSPAIPVKPAAAAPFRLLVGPVGYHNGTMSTKSENNLTVAPEGYVELFSADAARLGLADGSTVKLTSAAGSIIGKARISERLQPGLVFAPSHFPALNATSLLKGNSNLVAVQVEKG